MRMDEAFDDPGNEKNCGASHGESNAEGHEAEYPRRRMKEDRGQPAQEGSGDEKKAQDQDRVANQTQTSESLFSGHGATLTSRYASAGAAQR